MSISQFPQRIDLLKWEDSGFSWQGQVVVTQFSRLVEVLLIEGDAPQLDIDVQITQKNQNTWVILRASGVVWQQCQRCLDPIEVDVDVDTKLLLVEDETQIDNLADDIDFVMVSEVVSQSRASDRMLNIADMLEDELLLKLPLSKAKHADCELAVTHVGEIEEVETTDNPFSVLSQLKQKS